METIAVQTVVCLRSDPSRRGVVMAVAGDGPMAQYTVFIDGAVRMFFGEQICPCTVTATNWVDRETFQSYLTASLINTPSSRD